MGTGMKGLAKDTVIYGLTNIVSKFLNWLLAPFYIRVLADAAEYGIVTNLYAWVSVVLVVLTLGLETGLFRFLGTEEDKSSVYATCLRILSTTCGIFVLAGFVFLDDISAAVGYPAHPWYVGMFVVIVALDALMSLPFAYLRFEKKALKFAGFKFLFVLLNIFFNLFFLVFLPYLSRQGVTMPGWLYIPGFGVGYIFLSNLLASTIEFLCILPVLKPALEGAFSGVLFRRLVSYCLPLVLLGLAGNFNKMAGQILIPLLAPDHETGLEMVGIFGGNLKISVIMVMFLQAFRFAYDPFVFSKMKAVDADKAYRLAMNYFVFAGCLIFVFVMYWMPLFRHVVRPDYYSGLAIVPIMMASEVLFGIYYNLSIWYKVSDRTQFGALFSLIGLAVTVAIILWGVPRYGIIACAWAAIACNGIMLLLSYTLGRKYHPIRYNEGRILLSLAVTAAFYFGGMLVDFGDGAVTIVARTLLIIPYLALMIPLLTPEMKTLLLSLRRN